MMRRNPRQWARIVVVIVSCALASGQASKKLPNVTIIATGGTIAGEAATSTQSGYTSGQVGVETLIKAVPTLSKIAKVSGSRFRTSAARTCRTKSG